VGAIERCATSNKYAQSSDNHGGIAIIKSTAARGSDPKKRLTSLLLAAFLVLLTILGVAFSAGGPVQPPVDTTTLYSTTITWGPSHADPGRAYDTASAELIFNVYDTLISMGESVTNYLGAWNTYESYWAFTPSLSTNVPTRQEVTMTFADTGINVSNPIGYWFQPTPLDGSWYRIEHWLNDNCTDNMFGSYDVLFIGKYASTGLPIRDADSVRTWHVIEFMPDDHVTVHYYRYDFNIRASPAISFVDNTGDVVDGFDINDVQYTFEKACVRSLSPTWMLFKPLFDVMYVTEFNASMGCQTASWLWAFLIEDAFEIVSGDPPVFRINMGIPHVDGTFKQTLTQTYGSIMSREWCIVNGVWNGNLFEDINSDGTIDWYVTIARTNTPIDTITPVHYVGTGPYRVTTADRTIEGGLVVLEKNDLYWRGWPRPGQKAYLDKVQIDYVTDWAARKWLFLDGKSDVTPVPRVNMFELLDEFGDPIDPETKTVKSVGPALKADVVFYTWDVATTPYNPLYTGHFPDGVPTDFMNNVHVRNAFSYAFNHTIYLLYSYFGEAVCRETPGIVGLYPDYYTKGQWTSAGGTGKFNYNLTAMEAELKQAYFVQGAENKSVWDWGGFHIDIFYNAGSGPERITMELIKEGFDALNRASGKNFQVTVQAPDWATYAVYLEASCMPVWWIGWLADYPDAGNLYDVCMHSQGDLAVYQHYPPTTLGPRTGLNKDQLIQLAARTADGPDRADLYADLDDIYLADNPSLPIAQSLGRRWCKYWVKGWYYNALYPSQYYYHLYKEDTCWADVTGAITGVSDLKTDMRDISYVAAHFGAAAPDTSRAQPYDPRWAPGTYGNGGCDLLGDRKVDMRDVAFAAAHFLHQTQP
jgi:peptide/nickel transport system substrate-binding protein